RHRRARDRAGAKAHRLLARSRACHLCLRSGAVRRRGRRRLRRGRDYFRLHARRGRWSARRVPARRRQGRGGRGAARAGGKVRALVEDPAQRRFRSGLSRRFPARCPGAARAGDDVQGGGVTAVAEERSLGVPSQSRGSFLWGPLTRFALAIAVATAAVDQAAKLWLLFGLDLPARGIVRLTPFLDLLLTWNTGSS